MACAFSKIVTFGAKKNQILRRNGCEILRRIGGADDEAVVVFYDGEPLLGDRFQILSSGYTGEGEVGVGFEEFGAQIAAHASGADDCDFHVIIVPLQH